MKTRPLGRTGLSVTEICLGTMTWGEQNTEAEAQQQMDFALERGVTFWDTAELYPVAPIRAETQGRTEEFIGNWFSKTGRRGEVVLATKCAAAGPKHIRDGVGFVKGAFTTAVEGSLRRLQTDYIDLYQLHWPQRGSYQFRQIWGYDPSNQLTSESLDLMLENLRELQDLVDAGKIRAVGLSNESAWGTLQFLRLAEAHNLPRMASTQNEYSLLCRYFDADMAEVSHHEDVGLLAFSPLAAGLLTGKYADGEMPTGSRGSIEPSLGGRNVPQAHQAVENYKAVAEKYGLSLEQMSIAWCLTRPFMTSAIIGATSLNQLATNIDAADIALSAEVMADIAQARRDQPMPI